MQYNITYRQKDKGWQYIISFKENGKWKQKSKQGFKTKRMAQMAADKRLEELKEEWKNNLQISREYEGITFKQFANIFLEHEALYKEPSTIKNYGFAIKKYKDLYDMPMQQITTLHIQECTDNLVKEGINPATIKSYVGRIKTLFSRAVEPYKIISESPAKHIATPKEIKKEEIRALTKTQLNDLLGKIKNRKFYIASLLAATCGLRLGEILGLTWNDIDFINSTLTVNKQWKRLKNNKWGFGVVKSSNSNRTVPIPPKTLGELGRYKKEAVTDINNRIILYTAKTNFSSEIVLAYKKIGYDISIHDLRHTYATMLIGNGVDFKTAAKLLGHDVKETMNTYSHVTDDMLYRATSAVNNIFK